VEGLGRRRENAMATWRSDDGEEGDHGLGFGVWWALGEALTISALLVSLRLLGLV
jgi:hypothetical protein